MGRQQKQGREYAGRLQWVAMPMGEHRWTGGPLVCRHADDGWMVELSRHGNFGRVRIPLDGPWESLGDAKEAASRLLLAAKHRQLRRVGSATPVAA